MADGETTPNDPGQPDPNANPPAADKPGDKEPDPEPDPSIKAYIDEQFRRLFGARGRRSDPGDGSNLSPRQIEEMVARETRRHTAKLDQEKETDNRLTNVEAALQEVMPKEKPKGSFIQRFLWGEPD